jgi:hypothetical protein
MREWRKKNKEKVKECYEKQKCDIKYKYGYYRREAINKGRKYELTFKQSIKMFLNDCYYCGLKAFDGVLLNGIDRKNNIGDYTLDNCVPCCTMCNMMKGHKLDDKQFIKVCEHILTNLGVIDGNLYWDLFRDYELINFRSSKNSALRRNKKFQLTKLEFLNIVNNNCYLCGKNNTENHNNGIDRIFNGIDYCYDNCKACCGTCNHMKREYNLLDFLNKIIKIYKNRFKLDENIKIGVIYSNIIKPYAINKNIVDKELEKKRKIARKKKAKYRYNLRKKIRK